MKKLSHILILSACLISLLSCSEENIAPQANEDSILYNDPLPNDTGGEDNDPPIPPDSDG